MTQKPTVYRAAKQRRRQSHRDLNRTLTLYPKCGFSSSSAHIPLMKRNETESTHDENKHLDTVVHHRSISFAFSLLQAVSWPPLSRCRAEQG
ncbi:hypothetical protein IF2G_06614 [Cordyceps javanica]|nr:hypothetical protein IF2G_06614 [Cordyceps javanica]